jgi:hypothetical protein
MYLIDFVKTKVILNNKINSEEKLSIKIGNYEQKKIEGYEY